MLIGLDTIKSIYIDNVVIIFQKYGAKSDFQMSIDTRHTSILI